MNLLSTDHYFTLQALPLVSVFVGRKTDNDICRILTLAAGVDNPTYVEFPAPSADNPPPVGSPKWANYLKGMIAHFKGLFIHYFVCYRVQFYPEFLKKLIY